MSEGLTRIRLADRRLHIAAELRHDIGVYHCGWGFHADWRLGEVWLRAAKPDCMLDAMASDGAILLSLLLQYGVSIDEIWDGLTRRRDGSGGGPLGALLDLIAADFATHPVPTGGE